MITYGELNYIFKAIIMSLLFISSVVATGITVMAYTRRGITATKIILPVFIVFPLILCVLLKLIKESFVFGSNMPLLLQAINNSNFIILTLLALCSIFVTIFFFIIELKHKKNTVTTFSIKESLDNLPDGICYANEDGVIILSNHKINTISSILTGTVFRDANIFWNEIAGYENINRKILLLQDGTIWNFTREKVIFDEKQAIKISATDITELHNLSVRLQDNNEKMKEINKRLKEYNKNVEVVTRSRERLETKIRIHADLGETLLASRYALAQANKEDCMNAIEKWTFASGIFKEGAKTKLNNDQMEQLFKVANSLGVEIKINGSLPVTEATKNLILLSAAESLTNAVRHADATCLFVDITFENGYYTAKFTNDGRKPKGEISVGGGLSSLTKKLKENEGSLNINYGENGELIITVQVPEFIGGEII